MRIVHVIPGLTLERGGPSAVVQALTRHQAAMGHEVAVLTTDQGARNGERSVDLSPSVAIHCTAVRGSDRLAYAPDFARLAREQIRRSDIVHVHSIFTYPVHAALREAYACGVPVVLRPCGHLHRYSLRRSRLRKRAYLAVYGAMVRRAVSVWHYTSGNEARESWPFLAGEERAESRERRAEGRSCEQRAESRELRAESELKRSGAQLSALSSSLHERSGAQLSALSSSPYFVLPNGIDPAEFARDRDVAREAVWRSVPALHRAPYVLFLGRLHPKKRIDFLLDAFLSGAPAGFRLVVAGPDENGLWPELARRFLSDPRDAARVIRLGFISGDAKVDLLAGATLFALPSEHENFGIAAIESLAAGTPVLLSPHVDLACEALSVALVHTAPLDVAAWREELGSILSSAPPNKAARVNASPPSPQPSSPEAGGAGEGEGEPIACVNSDPFQCRPVTSARAQDSDTSDRTRRWVAEHYCWSRLSAELLERYRWVMAGCPSDSVVPNKIGASPEFGEGSAPVQPRSETCSLSPWGGRTL